MTPKAQRPQQPHTVADAVLRYLQARALAPLSRHIALRIADWLGTGTNLLTLTPVSVLDRINRHLPATALASRAR